MKDRYYENEPWASEMDEILGAIGGKKKTITDATTFYDFYLEDSEWRDLQELFRNLYQLEIDVDDYLWDAAEKVHDRAKFMQEMEAINEGN
jgi:hypothetical protein